jgi:two-component system LytT family response regulator
MIKALIVDDEAGARNSLETLLKKEVPEVTSIDLAENAMDAFFKIKEQQPDIVFLDIEMPFLNGFDLLSKIENIQFDIIFTTAYNQYAIQAIRFSALDYLLKPINEQELKTSVKRHVQRREFRLQTNQQYQNLVQNLFAKTSGEFRLAVSGAQGMQFFSISEIIRLEGDRNYTNFILTHNRKILSSKTLKEYEEILADKGFIRCHKSHLVNCLFIKEINPENFLLTKDGSKLEISRRRLSEVKTILVGLINNSHTH